MRTTIQFWVPSRWSFLVISRIRCTWSTGRCSKVTSIWMLSYLRMTAHTQPKVFVIRWCLNASVSAGVILIALSIFVGYFVEEVFKQVKIANWRRFLELIAVCYFMIALMLASLKLYTHDVRYLNTCLAIINFSCCRKVTDFHSQKTSTTY